MAASDKAAAYEAVLSKIEAAWRESEDPVARMATVAALIYRHCKGVVWSGFYLLRDEELTVGPYMGAPAAIRLPHAQGVCWHAVRSETTVVVPNVHEFEGHIRIEGNSNSEISIPLEDPTGRITGVLHLDHSDFDAFQPLDIEALERIATMIVPL